MASSTVHGYTLTTLLGKGRFGKVFLGEKRDNGSGKANRSEGAFASNDPASDALASNAPAPGSARVCAVKRMNRTKLRGRELVNLTRELEVLALVSAPPHGPHPNIVSLVEAPTQNATHVFFFLELCPGGELEDVLCEANGPLPARQLRAYACDLVRGLAFLHSCGVVHRDLKPQNVLVDCSGALRIADFGFSRTLDDGALADSWLGSPLYMAPEVIQHRPYNHKADLWSLGAILFRMATGDFLANGSSRDSFFQTVLATPLRVADRAAAASAPPTLVALLTALLQKRPVDRAPMAEVLLSAWLDLDNPPLASSLLDGSEFFEVDPASLPDAAAPDADADNILTACIDSVAASFAAPPSLAALAPSTRVALAAPAHTHTAAALAVLAAAVADTVWPLDPPPPHATAAEHGLDVLGRAGGVVEALAAEQRLAGGIDAALDLTLAAATIYASIVDARTDNGDGDALLAAAEARLAAAHAAARALHARLAPAPPSLSAAPDLLLAHADHLADVVAVAATRASPALAASAARLVLVCDAIIATAASAGVPARTHSLRAFALAHTGVPHAPAPSLSVSASFDASLIIVDC